MKVLLDEQIDIRMKAALQPFEVFTLHDMGWIGFKNGALLKNLNDSEFQGFITADKNLPFQHNLEKIKFLLILLDTPTLLWMHQVLFVPKLLDLIAHPPTSLTRIAHIAVVGISQGKKRAAIERLLPAQQLLFL